MRHEGFHGRAGFGRRPALLVVDINVGFTDPASPLACELEDVVAAIRRLLDEARRAALPVVYTTVSYGEGDKVAAAAFIDKIPALLTLEAGSRWVEIDPRLAPAGGGARAEQAVRLGVLRDAALELLDSARCDSLVVTGASTSGCVRATVVDAFQHGYRTIVPREAVGDRDPAAHEANLHDIDAKYGDVVSVEDVVAHLEDVAAAHAR